MNNDFKNLKEYKTSYERNGYTKITNKEALDFNGYYIS